jgi:hypothetical protein
MKFAASLALAAALLSSVCSAGYNGKPYAKKADKESFHLKPGSYRFVNVASHKGLKYVRNGQQLYATKGKGDWIKVKSHHAHIILSPGSNKCVSAAWSYGSGANNYAALYECDVARFQKRGEVIPADAEKRAIAQSIVDFEVPLVKRSPANASQGLEKRTKLRKDKQYFYMHPASKKHTWHILAYDHIKDQPPRVVSDCVVTPKWAKKSKWSCLVKLNHKDMHQAWYIYNKKGKLM